MLILVTTLKVVQIFLVIGFPLLFVMIHGLNGSDHRFSLWYDDFDLENSDDSHNVL